MAGRISIDVSHNTAEAGATQINNVTNNFATDPEQIDRDCLRALQCPDSFRVKNQLKASKDVLLRESFDWILHDPHYLRWRDGQDVALLWIKGGAGKGKTMMSIGLVEELSRASQDTAVVIYFFCQNADSSLNTVNAIIKGLIHQLVRERPHAIQELRAKWDHSKGQFITTKWQDLWGILLAMLDRCKQDRIFVVVDALDECRESLAQLLRQIISTSLHDPDHVKWLLTSRPLDVAEQILLSRPNQALVSLELNLDLISQSVASYVSMKVAELTRTWRRCSQDLRRDIEQELVAKAGSTFLWVSLICKELQHVNVEEALLTIERAPAGLQETYKRAYSDLCKGHANDVAGCKQLLRVIMLAFRPLNVVEVSNLMHLTTDNQSLDFWFARSASFVQMQMQEEEEVPYLVFAHQSARDYLVGLEEFDPSDALFSVNHTEMALRCLTYLADNLTANVLQAPNCDSTRDMILERAELPRGLRYPAEQWLIHLQAAEDNPPDRAVLKKDGPVEMFLRRRVLEWLEFLSLTDWLRRAREALNTLAESERIKKHRDSGSYAAILSDTCQFLDINYDMIWKWPLQVYRSALIFTPESSEIKQLNLMRIPEWLRYISEMEAGRSSLQEQMSPSPSRTMVFSVVFSPDGQLLALKMDAIEVWEAQTGRLCSTIDDHFTWALAGAFSHDGQLFASGDAFDGIFKVWEARTGKLRYKLGGHYKWVSSVTLSPNGQLIAAGTFDGKVGVWETQTGRLHRTLQSRPHSVDSVAFSPNGQLIASVSADDTGRSVIQVWKDSQISSIKAVFRHVLRQTPKWKAICTIQTNGSIKRLRFSHDGKQLITDCGRYPISDPNPARDPTTCSNTNELILRNEWIFCGSTALLYLPQQYEARCFDSHGDEIAIGCSTGRIWRSGIDRKLALSLEKREGIHSGRQVIGR